SWNSISWGVETVGEYDVEPFGEAVRENLVHALAVLHGAAGLSPLPYELGRHGLHFHKEDPHTTHKDCPGRHMVKADLVAAVLSRISQLHLGDHLVDRPIEPSPPAAPPASSPSSSSSSPKHDVARLQAELNKHGAELVVDGDYGPKTRAAVVRFQQANGLAADGIAGRITVAALEQAIAA